LRVMANQSVSIVPRGRRDDSSPPAPLDPYVISLLRWIESRDQRLNPNTLAKQAASALNWPLPFAEAIVTATRARRLLTLVQANTRGGYRIGLTRRGHAWLERSATSIQSPVE
jgi:hypothetical protein